SQHVLRPVPRTVVPPLETTSFSSDDPPTSLSLSLPGVESSEALSNRVIDAVMANAMPLLSVMEPPPPPPSVTAQKEVNLGAFNFSNELMAVMQEMI
ncbi:hypothetical protein, partial [Escherichia coli]|uniref:hypothetical protein n=1 Tax=Escherichia coli TaxID=562 RepID=UPI001961E637